MSEITPPKTYSEWVEIFDILKSRSNDEIILNAMQEGSIRWQSGVAQRFAKRLTDVINYRMNSASDRFQKGIMRANGQERVIIQNILELRREMKFLVKVAGIPAIPEKDRECYCRLVLDQADIMQKSLEDSAKKDTSGRLAGIIRNNRVNAL